MSMMQKLFWSCMFGPPNLAPNMLHGQSAMH